MYGIYGMNASKESATFMGFGLGLETPKTASLFFGREAQSGQGLLLSNRRKKCPRDKYVTQRILKDTKMDKKILNRTEMAGG